MLIGIEIGGTKLQVVMGRDNGEIRSRIRFEVDPRLGAEGILNQIGQALDRLPLKDVQSVGIGFGGPVDPKSGRVICSHQIEGWTGLNLGDWIEKRVGKPVQLDNDANTAALAEAILGSGKGFNPVFYATLGSGIGGGLVADGRLYRGAPPGEAEVGHIRLDKSGTTLESRCSGWAMDRRIRDLCREHTQSDLARLCREKPDRPARHLTAALDKKDPIAVQLLEELTSDLALGLSHVTHLFHPAVIVIGGGLSKLGDPLFQGLRKKLPEWLMEAYRPGPQIHPAGLDEDVVPIGALLLAASLCEKTGKID